MKAENIYSIKAYLLIRAMKKVNFVNYQEAFIELGTDILKTAVQQYDEKKGNFDTFAYYCLLNEFMRQRVDLTRLEEIFKALSPLQLKIFHKIVNGVQFEEIRSLFDLTQEQLDIELIELNKILNYIDFT